MSKNIRDILEEYIKDYQVEKALSEIKQAIVKGLPTKKTNTAYLQREERGFNICLDIVLEAIDKIFGEVN
jgi:hypothetical protein